MIYLQLFLAYLKVGFFDFGGGSAMIALSYHEVVLRHHWLTGGQMADMIALAQMTPGPTVINVVTHIGYAVTGDALGALLAVVAVSLPSLTIMLLLTRFYLLLSGNRYVSGVMKGIQPMTIAMICAAALVLISPETFVDWKSWAIFGGGFLALVFGKVNPILLVIASGLLGMALYL